MIINLNYNIFKHLYNTYGLPYKDFYKYLTVVKKNNSLTKVIVHSTNDIIGVNYVKLPMVLNKDNTVALDLIDLIYNDWEGYYYEVRDEGKSKNYILQDYGETYFILKPNLEEKFKNTFFLTKICKNNLIPV